MHSNCEAFASKQQTNLKKCSLITTLLRCIQQFQIFNNTIVCYPSTKVVTHDISYLKFPETNNHFTYLNHYMKVFLKIFKKNCVNAIKSVRGHSHMRKSDYV